MKYYASGIRSQWVKVEFEAPAGTDDYELKSIAAQLIDDDEDCYVKSQDVTDVTIDDWVEEDF